MQVYWSEPRNDQTGQHFKFSILSKPHVTLCSSFCCWSIMRDYECTRHKNLLSSCDERANKLTDILSFKQCTLTFSKGTVRILTFVCRCSYIFPVSRTLLDMPKSAILHILLWSTRTLRAARSRWIICGNILSMFSKLTFNGCLQRQARLLTVLQLTISCFLLLELGITLLKF